MNNDFLTDEAKFTILPKTFQEIEFSTNMVEAAENKPKLTVTSSKSETKTSNAMINDSVLRCDLLGLNFTR